MAGYIRNGNKPELTGKNIFEVYFFIILQILADIASLGREKKEPRQVP